MAVLGNVLVVRRWHHENIVAPDFEPELWKRALRRALQRCASARVESAVVAGAFDLPLVRLVKHRAGKLHQRGAGKPYCGYATITGQGNGQGGREHGHKCDQLPGNRDIEP